MTRDSRFIDLAVEIARSSPNKKYKHAALLTKGGNILAVGQNTENPIYPDSHKTRHAEEDCFYRSELNKTACNLYVVRVLSSEPTISTLSEPCEDCYQYLLWNTRVKRVWFTLNWRHNGKPGIRCVDLNYRREREEPNSKTRGRASNYRPVRRMASS